jgi:class 3 adenylate cyclase/tetratricopeptide (TPR) repeat protein
VDELAAVAQYLPRALLSHPVPRSGWWRADGTLLFSDVSGFTSLSEKLARHGKAGAEEMVGAISTVFTPLLDEIAAHDGDVLKFGGDALLTFFEGPHHERRAAACAHRLRLVLRSQGRVTTTFGAVPLGMSQGLHSDEFTFFVSGTRYADIVVTGPPVTATLALESAAARGEVLVSPSTAAELPARCLRPGHDGGALLTSPGIAPTSGPDVRTVTATTRHERFVPLALRGRLAQVVDDSEHRRATVGFLQFAGCDDSLRGDGPDGLQQRLNRVVDAVTDAAEEYGVTMICVDIGADGGKFMLTCGAPDAQEHDAELLLRFGARILAEPLPLRLRLGVNAGAIFAGRVGGAHRWTYSTMGDPVNLAARVMGKAAPGTVLATRTALDRAGKAIRYDVMPPFAVKGKRAPVHAGVVTGVTDRREAGAGPASAPLVGREAELAAMVDAWRQVRSGRGRVVEIVGDPGSGKSRLVDEAIAACSPPTVIRAAGERYHRGSAYFAAHLVVRAATGISPDADPSQAGISLSRWVDERAPHLHDLLPLLAVAARAQVPTTETVERLAPAFRAARLRSATVDLLRTALPGPTVLLLEDAFWYDSASVQLLTDVLVQSGERPWLVMVTRRDETTGLHLGLGYPATELRLAALTDDHAAALVRALVAGPLPSADARALAVAGRGNPFFVVQLAQSWRPGDATLPPDVESVVAARLDRLPLPSRRLLARAAVIGSFVDLDLLTAVIGQPPDPALLTPLLGEFLVTESADRLRFAHDLFRVVAYESLPYRQRRELHARAGAALERAGHRAARASLLSVHFEAAGDARKAWRYSRMGADRARAAYATAEAAELYARALRVARALPDISAADLATVAEALGDMLELSGRYDDAVDALAAARRSCPTAADEVRLIRKIGMVRERQSRYRAALRWFTQGTRHLDDLEPAAAAAARASLLVHEAAVRYRQGRFRDSVRAARAAADTAKEAGSAADLAHAYFLLDAALTDLQDPRAVEYRDLALPIYERLGDLVGQADVHNNIGIDAYYEGRLDDALASYRRSLDCRRRAGDVVGAATAENNIGEVLSDLGRFDEAEPMFDEALAVWRRAPFPAGVARVSVNLAKLAVRRGSPQQALTLLDDAEQLAGGVGADMFLFEARACRAETLLALGDAQGAAALTRLLLSRAAQLTPSPVVMASLRFTLGLSLRAAGSEAEALVLLHSALADFEATGMVWDAEQARAALEPRIVLPQQRTASVAETEVTMPQHGPM